MNPDFEPQRRRDAETACRRGPIVPVPEPLRLCASAVKIVAFLQNLWVRDPVKVAALFARHPENREALLRRFLFYKSKTGRVLQAVFGPAWCDRIVWEESTPEIGGDAKATFPPDRAHIIGVLKKHRPAIVLAFGRTAANGVFSALQQMTFAGERENFESELLTGPHPACIGAGVLPRLREMRASIERRTGSQPGNEATKLGSLVT